MTDDKRNELLVQEYWELQKITDKYGERALVIKGWSVTFSAAGLGVAYTQHAPILLLVSSLSALAFWVTEGAWKAWQKAFYKRIEDIEDYFAGKISGIAPLQVARTWETSFNKYWLIHRKPLLKPNVLVPHVVVAAAGVILYLWGPPA